MPRLCWLWVALRCIQEEFMRPILPCFPNNLSHVGTFSTRVPQNDIKNRPSSVILYSCMLAWEEANKVHRHQIWPMSSCCVLALAGELHQRSLELGRFACWMCPALPLRHPCHHVGGLDVGKDVGLRRVGRLGHLRKVLCVDVGGPRL